MKLTTGQQKPGGSNFSNGAVAIDQLMADKKKTLQSASSKSWNAKFRLWTAQAASVAVALCIIAFTGVEKANAQFTPGNIVVLQTKGTASKGPSQAVLQEYTTGGTGGITVTLDSTSGATHPFLTDGQYGGSEGFLSTSTDSKFLVLGGYGTYTAAADITATTSAAVARVVGKVDASGTYTQMYSSNTFYSANDIRGGVSDGTNFWASGASVKNVDGIDYYGPGTQTKFGTDGTNPAKAYGERIFNNQIYFSTEKQVVGFGATAFGIFTLGGEPTSGTATITQIINTTVATLEDFTFSDDGKTCYIANNATGGGIQKWTNSTAWATSGWALAYTLSTGFGYYGIVGDYSGGSGNYVLYATTNEAQASGNRVVKIIDTGSGATPATIVSPVAGVTHKGIAFAPCSSAPTSVSATSSPACVGSPLNVSASATGAASYTWAGPLGFSAFTENNSGSETTLVNSSASANMAGTYTVTAANGCGSATATVAVTVDEQPTPTASSNSPVPTGGTINLSSSGGTSYAWTGPNSFTSNLQNPTIANASSLNAGVYTVAVTNGSCSSATASTTVSVQAIAGVPTLNEWGLIALSILVLGAGVFFVRGRLA